MKSLNVEIHPDKPWLGRVKNGFDFLGFRITPTSIQPSTESVSRRDKKVARLYEQGASKKRIGQYLRRWLGWGLVGALVSSPAMALPNGTAAQCPSAIDNQICAVIASPDMAFNSCFIGASQQGQTNLTNPIALGASSFCQTPNAPDADDTVCENPGPITVPTDATFFYNVTSSAAAFRCVYEITFSTAPVAASVRTVTDAIPDPVSSNAQNIPVFGPFGLLAMLMGLVWFGNRRRAKGE